MRVGCTERDRCVQVIENYGQLRVTLDEKPCANVYVKVYADCGGTRFWKDGYTGACCASLRWREAQRLCACVDFRGKFDYVTISGGQVQNVRRFALLIMSENDGSCVKTANPPKM